MFDGLSLAWRLTGNAALTVVAGILLWLGADAWLLAWPAIRARWCAWRVRADLLPRERARLDARDRAAALASGVRQLPREHAGLDARRRDPAIGRDVIGPERRARLRAFQQRR